MPPVDIRLINRPRLVRAYNGYPPVTAIVWEYDELEDEWIRWVDLDRV